jgi:hypothetical protein
MSAGRWQERIKMTVVVVFEGTENSVRGVFGPFADPDAAREWAEANFPRHAWQTEDVEPAF